jgi:hypothetical protein
MAAAALRAISLPEKSLIITSPMSSSSGLDPDRAAWILAELSSSTVAAGKFLGGLCKLEIRKYPPLNNIQKFQN